MPDNKQLIDLLLEHSASGYCSGTFLGQQLAISRVAVQKRLQSLIQLGLPIEAVHSKGYRLAKGVSLLSHDKILSLLSQSDRQKLAKLFVLEQVESTNTFLSERVIEQGKACVCVAESQPQGRGRNGNQWVADPYRNIMLSMSWTFSQWPETISGLGLAMALVVAEWLNAEFDVDVQIKWPNDLLLNGKKLAGVLVDVRGEAGGVCELVMGIGLNVCQAQSKTDDYLWQDLHSLGIQPNRNDLVAGIISQWLPMLESFQTHGFGLFTQRWNRLSCYSGCRVVAKKGQQVHVQGVVEGVDEMGALLIREADGNVQRVLDSSLSVRVLD